MPRSFSGRECWVFVAEAVSHLCGHHAEAIRQALGDREPAYLLYSPLREGGHGPFRLAGPSGSHALALTATDLILSRDPHLPHERRTVRIVPLTSILTIALGEALTLGWLVLRFVADGQCASEVVFFHSHGIRHFRELVRVWLGRLPARDTPVERQQPWHATLRTSPEYLTNQVVPLLLETDRLEATVCGSEEWSASRKNSRCLTPSTLIVATNRAVMIAESERPDRPGQLVFGVNALCVARSALTCARVEPLDPLEPRASTLSLAVEVEGVAANVSAVIGARTDGARDRIAVLGQLLRPTSRV